MNAAANYYQYFLLIFAFIFSITAQERIFESNRAQVEAPIAINPTNPQNQVGAAITIKDNNKQIGYYYSFDGGVTWDGSENTLGNDGADPVVAFDPDGTAYLLYQKRSEGKLLLHKSTGGGMNWSDPPITVVDLNTAIKNVDRPWMAFSLIRNQNTQKFNLYISYTLEDVNNNSYSIALHRSRDGGENFELIEEISPGANHILQGSYVAVDPEGKVYLAWAELKFSDSAVEKIHVNLYANEGGTLESSHARATQQIGEPHGNKQFFVKGGRVRVDSYPRITVDHSLNAGTRGRAYIVWAGKLSEIFDAEILMIRRKKDVSGNWVWDDGTVHIDEYLQWQPAPGVSPDGVLSVLFYNSESNRYDDPITAYLRKSFDGGETFTANILNNPGFTLFSGSAPFQPLLGDYHGLTSWRGKVYGLWSEHHTDHAPDDPIQLYFRAFDVNEIPPPSNYSKVVVKQLDENFQAFGKVGRWNQGAFTNYTAPYEFVLEEETEEVLRADQEFKPGTTQKYNHWLINNVFDNIVNHDSFTIVNNQPPISASFKTAHNATIQTRLVTPGQANVGYVEFKDPWLRIDGDPKYYDPPYGYRNLGMDEAELEQYSDLPLELLTTSNFKGVFLDQVPDPINPEKPYYSVRAPQTQDINLPQSGRTHRFHFWKWDALPPAAAEFQNANAPQTPVVFKNPNVVVQANYKGTQVGNSYQSNGQKKFLNCQGKLFSVYEDANTIWLESSEDNGLTWNLRNNAQPLGTAGAQCPSLSTDGTTLLITYQENASTIKIVSYDDYDQEIVEVASLSVSNPEEARLYPSSDFSFAAGSVILTGWEVDGAVWCRIGRVWNATYPHIGATYGATHWPLMESNGSGLSLAVANDHSFHLTVSKRTASDRSAVIYRKIRINKMGSDDPDLWELDLLYDVDVSKGGSYPMNIEPCISARHHGDPWIADPIVSWTAGVWTGQQLSYTVASVRVGSQGGQSWGTIQTYSQYPNEIIWTVNNSVYSQQQTVIIWSAGSPPASKWVSRSGAFYSTPQSLSHAGSQVHICPGSSLQNMYAMVFNPPAFTQASTDFSQELPFESPLARSPSQFNLSYGRSGVIYKDSLEFIFHFGDVLVEDSVIGFIPVPDTTVFSSTSQLNQGLISEDFLLQPNSSFQLRTRYEVLNRLPVHSALTDSDRVSFKVELVDAINHTVAGLIDSVTYHKGNLKKQKKNNFQINCSAISPGRYYLRMNLAVTGAAEFTRTVSMDA